MTDVSTYIDLMMAVVRAVKRLSTCTRQHSAISQKAVDLLFSVCHKTESLLKFTEYFVVPFLHVIITFNPSNVNGSRLCNVSLIGVEMARY